MSTATKEVETEETAGNALGEVHHCHRCTGVIAPECVRGMMKVDQRNGRTLRIIRTWCDHCEVLVRQTFKIAGEQLSPINNPVIVTDSKERAEFLGHVDRYRGNVQLRKRKSA